jgi:YVTN family beta-propeller protein
VEKWLRPVLPSPVVVEGRVTEFLILGPLEVCRGDEVVQLGAAKQRALLGVLLLHANETVSTSRLAEELWGERPPATAEKLVQGYVHALRKRLGDGVLATRPPGYKVNVQPGALDLREFERLTEEARTASVENSIELRRRALALWRGPALADLVLNGPERHNVERLGELRLTTQVERIAAELQLGRHAELVGELEPLVAEHSYHERLAALLMLALYRSGRQADALGVYRTVRRRLSDELGLQPGQELRDLEASILRQDDSLAISPPTLRAELTPSERVPTTTVMPAASRSRGRTLAVAGALLLLAAATIAIAALLLRDRAAGVVVPPNSVAVIDPATNRVTTTLQTGIGPAPVASGAGSVWIGNLDDTSLTQVDAASRTVAGTIPLPATPTAIAVGPEVVWVVNARLGTLYRVHPKFETVISVEVGPRSIRHTGAGIDLGEGSVWAAYGDSTLARVDPETREGRAAASGGVAPAGLVIASGFVWVSDSEDATVRRFSPRTWELGAVGAYPVCRGPSGLAAGDGSIWVACTADDVVARIPADLGSRSYTPIPVGDRPASVAFGAGAVWVANSASGTVSRVDPDTNEVVRTMAIGNAPTGITVSGGLVWVTVQAP